MSELGGWASSSLAVDRCMGVNSTAASAVLPPLQHSYHRDRPVKGASCISTPFRIHGACVCFLRIHCTTNNDMTT